MCVMAVSVLTNKGRPDIPEPLIQPFLDKLFNIGGGEDPPGQEKRVYYVKDKGNIIKH